jgi:hypothetical protein
MKDTNNLTLNQKKTYFPFEITFNNMCQLCHVYKRLLKEIEMKVLYKLNSHQR